LKKTAYVVAIPFGAFLPVKGVRASIRLLSFVFLVIFAIYYTSSIYYPQEI